MAQYEVTLIALNIRKWDLESQRLSLTTYFVMDDEEKSLLFELSLTQPPEMVEEFLGKIRMGCQRKMRNGNGNGDSNGDGAEEETTIIMANETFLRQKLYNYFKRILMELNNPKRKKGQSKMIFTTHMDIYNENQDISFLPQIIQFFVVLNWARKYYEKEDYQKAVDPLRKLVKIKPDFGLGYKWLARSLKKVRKYDDAMRFYERYAEVDNSLDARLDLAKSYRKGKIFDKSEEIYNAILAEEPDVQEARIGLSQIKYARNEDGYMEILDKLNEEDSNWLKKWLLEEFNFRIYVSPKTPLTPIQAANYLGFGKVFELTQRAFRNDVPSHFNPSKARMSFYKEELDKWAEIMNRYKCKPEEVLLHPENLQLENVRPVELDINGEAKTDKPQDTGVSPVKRSTRVEEIIRSIRASRARNAVSSTESSESGQDGPPVKRKRGRPRKHPIEPPVSTVETSPASDEEKPKRRRGRPPKKREGEEAAPAPTITAGEAPVKRRRGRPPKNAKIEAEKTTTDNSAQEEPPVKRKRGRPKKKVIENPGEITDSNAASLPGEEEFLLEMHREK